MTSPLAELGLLLAHHRADADAARVLEQKRLHLGAGGDHARLFVAQFARPRRIRIVVRNDLGRDAQPAPQKARVARGDAGAAVENRLRHAAIRRVLAGFAQQDTIAAAGGQSVGQD
jgi:hypothetical protein